MLRVHRVFTAAAAVFLALVGTTALVGGVAYGKPNEVTVAVSGCVVQVKASGFDAEVEVVNWSIQRSGSSTVLRSGQIGLDSNGAGSSSVSPELDNGQYRVTWSYAWRGQSTRTGEAFFGVSSCGESAPSSPRPSPTQATTAEPTPSASSTTPAAAPPAPTSTPTPSVATVGGATILPARTSAENNTAPGFIVAVIAFALAIGGAAAYLASRRKPKPRRSQRRAAGAGPNLRFSGPSAPEP